MRAFFLGNAGDAARFGGAYFLGERGWCGVFLWVRGAGEPGDGAGVLRAQVPEYEPRGGRRRTGAEKSEKKALHFISLWY